MSSQAVAANVRVASYNILSSKLARKDHFCNCAEDALSAHARLPRILAKIDAEVARGAVVCLQEVCLHTQSPLPIDPWCCLDIVCRLFFFHHFKCIWITQLADCLMVVWEKMGLLWVKECSCFIL